MGLVCLFSFLIGLLSLSSRLIFKTWIIPSDSMENTILKGDYCVSNQAYYGLVTLREDETAILSSTSLNEARLGFREPLKSKKPLI